MSFVFASGRMHQQMNFWRPQEKEYPLTGTSDLLLLFIACVAVAPRSYIPEPNELGPTDTTFAPRSLRERRSCWGTPGKRRLCTGRDGQRDDRVQTTLIIRSFSALAGKEGLGRWPCSLGESPKTQTGEAKWAMMVAFRADGACVDLGMLTER